jgi:hypothetical protein
MTEVLQIGRNKEFDYSDYSTKYLKELYEDVLKKESDPDYDGKYEIPSWLTSSHLEWIVKARENAKKMKKLDKFNKFKGTVGKVLPNSFVKYTGKKYLGFDPDEDSSDEEEVAEEEVKITKKKWPWSGGKRKSRRTKNKRSKRRKRCGCTRKRR